MRSPPRDAAPVGVVTALLLEAPQGPDGSSADALEAEVRRTLEGIEPREVRPVPEGLLLAFDLATDAVRAALRLEERSRAPAPGDEPGGAPESVALPGELGIGIHSVECRVEPSLEIPPSLVERCIRLGALGVGGRIVLSRTTRDLVAGVLPAGVRADPLGSHRMDEEGTTEEVYEVVHGPARGSSETLPFEPVRNLPAYVSSFVGREQEVARTTELVRTERLMTFVGAGGCGKTRLAHRVVESVAPSFEDGACWVELAPVTEPDLVVMELARVLDIRPSPFEALEDSLVRRLQSRRMLIVLDNCEHLIDETARLAERLLSACRRVSVLATSREALGVPGEVAWRVPSLATGDDDHASMSDAFRLFVERATAARPTFQVTAANTPVIAQICRQLDGIPLALELAAARVRSLSVEAIREALSDSFRLLVGHSRRAVSRHQTLRASVEWSYGLLTHEERILFRRLAVFSGGWTLEAAEEVTAYEPVAREDVLPLLSSLVDKSLVQLEDLDDGCRYEMLETIRQYAGERAVDFPDLGRAREEHAAYFRRFADLVASNVEGPTLGAWLKRVDADLDNLRSAMLWSAELGDDQSALGMAVALSRYWTVRAPTEGKRTVEAVLAGVKDQPVLQARAAAVLIILRFMVGDIAGALAAAEEATPLAERYDTASLSRVNAYLGWMHHFLEPQKAEAYFRKAIDLALEADDAFFVVESRCGLGAATMLCGDPKKAREILEDVVAETRRSGPAPTLVRALIFLSQAVFFLGDVRLARELMAEAVQVAREVRDELFLAIALAFGGWTHAVGGDAASAREHIGSALAVAQRLNNPVAMSFGMMCATSVHLSSGDLDAAEKELESATSLAAAIGFRWTVAGCLHLKGELAWMRGDLERAEAELEQALDLARSSGMSALVNMVVVPLARLAGERGDGTRAETLLHEALELIAESETFLLLPDTLEGLAARALEEGSYEEAARLFGAAEAGRSRVGSVVLPPFAGARERDLLELRARAGDDLVGRAWQEGAAVDPSEILAYVRRGRGERKRPSTGWGSLTPTELQVVELVAEGLSNNEIAQRMFVSPGTVKTHLSHVYAKLGMANRAEVSAELVRRGTTTS